jgi:hypothetical protein
MDCLYAIYGDHIKGEIKGPNRVSDQADEMTDITCKSKMVTVLCYMLINSTVADCSNLWWSHCNDRQLNRVQAVIKEGFLFTCALLYSSTEPDHAMTMFHNTQETQSTVF